MIIFTPENEYVMLTIKCRKNVLLNGLQTAHVKNELFIFFPFMTKRLLRIPFLMLDEHENQV